MTDTKLPRHPMQPIFLNEKAEPTFRPNAIIRHYFGRDAFNLSQIAANPEFSQEDLDQFWQLIGYTVSEYRKLRTASPESISEAEREAVRVVDGANGLPKVTLIRGSALAVKAVTAILQDGRPRTCAEILSDLRDARYEVGYPDPESYLTGIFEALPGVFVVDDAKVSLARPAKT